MNTRMTLYCCGCKTAVEANLTDGSEIYPRRKDLHKLKFWKCHTCKNYVGTHKRKKHDIPNWPLGCIPDKEMKKARQHIHSLIDPIWRTKKMTRKAVYQFMSDKMGSEYHTAQLRTIPEARRAYKFGLQLQSMVEER